MGSSTRLNAHTSHASSDMGAHVAGPLPDARQVEVDRALALVDLGRGSIVWTGEYGMGRSTLLDATFDRLRRGGDGGPRVLARLTVESRANARGGPQGNVGDLIAFLVEDPSGEPDDALSHALTAALGGARSHGSAVDVWEAVHAAVGDRTLILVVDDLEECAPAAVDRLLRMLRNESLHIVMLATALRSPFGARSPHEVEVRHLPPLGTEAALLVLSSVGCLPVAPHVARQLVDKLGGNPACLIQTARALTSEQLAGASLLPDPLPVVPAVRAALALHVAGLTARDKSTLLAAAVMVIDRLDTLTAATGVSIVGLTQGRLADQLTPIAGRFSFADPRLRALIHGEASLAERTTAHVALAGAHRDAGDQGIAAWHTALATLEGDSAVVPELLALSRRHLRRGDTEWAHAVAREAVGHASGDERVLACELSGIAALLSGHVHDASHWLPHAARSGDLASRARTLLGLTMALTLTEGRVPDDLLERTRAEVVRMGGGGVDERIATDVSRGLTVAACLHLERGEFDAARARMLEASALVEVEEPCAHEGTSLARAWLAMYSGEFAAEAELPEQARLIDDEALEAVARAVTLMHRGDSSAAARVLASAVAELAPLRHGGRWFGGPDRAVSPLVEAHIRVVQALVEMRAGDVSRAAATMRDAAASLPVGVVLAGLGVTLSRRLDTVRDGRIGPTSAALAATSPCAEGATMRLGMLVDRALAASFREEHVQAATLLELAAEREMRERGVVMAVPGLDAVETWAMAGRPEEARQALERLRSSLTALSPSASSAALARAELALATRANVEQRALAATLAARNLESAYERGKVELSIGRAMARLDVREAALAHLMAAQDLFEESGARAWATLVGLEGERAGRTAASRRIVIPVDPEVASLPNSEGQEADSAQGSASDEDWAADLTEREREVALLVAQGLANREVAERLFCSVRTVEVHLGRVYRKLDLRSRFELVVLAHSPDSDG